MVRRLRWLLALALAAAALTAPPAAAQTRPTLRATLRITGSGAAFTPVRLVRALRVNGLARGVTARGDTGHITLMLVSARDPSMSMVAERLPLSVGEPWYVTGPGDGTGDAVLPPGEYRAYLVAAKRTTVTIRLPGQPAGVTAVATRTRVPYRISEPVVEKVAGHYRAVSEVNETFTFTEPGMAVAIGVIDYASMWDYTIGGCFYEGYPPPGEDTAQVCAGGTAVGTGGGYVVPSTTPSRVVGGILTLPIRPRTVSFGVYYRFAGQITRVRQYQLWVQYLP